MICGVRSPPDIDGVYNPSSILLVGSTPLVFDVANSSIIEVNDVCFSTRSDANAVYCCGGGKILFRRCKFTAIEAAIASTGPDVMFENCLFESEQGSGAIVDGKGAQATFLHCTIRDCGGMGIEVRNHSSGTLYACRLYRIARQGVIGYMKGNMIKVYQCLFSNITRDSAIMVSEKCGAIINEVAISSTKIAGVVCQRDPGLVAISKLRVSGCMHGFMAQALVLLLQFRKAASPTIQ